MTAPMVSVICITYNHELYIEEALQGMVNQKTDFDYEIIVHDDASTDGTADIVRRYQQKYPDKVKPIFQQENQRSKGVVIMNRIFTDVAKGKYIALCEGDDYWIDDYKLQKQIDYMETHPGCTLCFHDVKRRNMRTGLIIDTWHWNMKVYQIYRGEGIYSGEETIKLKAVPTASMLFRRKDMPYPEDLRSDKAGMGDTIITMYLGTKGYSYCMQDTMAVYRKGVNNSMTDTWRHSMDNHNRKSMGTVETMEKFDAYTNGMYHEIIDKHIEAYQRRLVAFDEKAVENVVKKADKVYIYGTGRYAVWCTQCMEERQIDIAGYVVSDEEYKVDHFRDKEVYRLTEICAMDSATDSTGIIIGTSDRYSDEIIEQLTDCGIDNFCQGIIKQQSVLK